MNNIFLLIPIYTFMYFILFIVTQGIWRYFTELLAVCVKFSDYFSYMVKMKKSSEGDYMYGEYNHLNPFRGMADLKNFRRKYIDPLNMLLVLTLEPMRYKIIILILIYVTSQFSFALLLTTYRILSTFDETILLKHGSFGGIEIFVLVNLWTVLLKYKEIMWFADVVQQLGMPLPASIMGKQQYNENRMLILILKTAVLANLALAFFAALGFTLSPEYFNTRTYLAVWLKENFPDYAEYILFFIHLSNFPVALVSASLSIVMSYFGYTTVLQFTFLNELVQNICESSIPEQKRLSSEVYQRSVKGKLKVSIMLHSLAARLCNKAGEIIFIPLIAFAISTVILGGALLLEIITTDTGEMSNQYVGIICFVFCGGLSSALYVGSCQHLKNESEKTLYLLEQLPWYYMDKDNLQIYRIFALRAHKPISINTKMMEMNYLLLVRVLKAIYSFAAVVAQFVTTTAGTSQ